MNVLRDWFFPLSLPLTGMGSIRRPEPPCEPVAQCRQCWLWEIYVLYFRLAGMGRYGPFHDEEGDGGIG